MHILEFFTSSKTGSEDDNEDSIVFSAHYAAVIDGATRDRSIRINGATPGRLIAQIISQRLKHIEAGLAGVELIDSISRLVRNELWPLAGKQDPSLMFNASLVVYTARCRTVTSVGDCQCRIGDDIHAKTKKIDVLLAEMRSVYNRLTGLSLAEYNGGDPGRDLITPVLKLQPILANSDNCPGYNYGVVNGKPVPADFVETWQVDRAQQIIFASDGYLLPEPTLEAAEIAIRNRLNIDPGMDRIPPYATKGADAMHTERSFDDRSYLRFVAD